MSQGMLARFGGEVLSVLLMAKTGYDPVQAVLFWKRMAQATNEKEKNGQAAFPHTHPTNAKRIRQIEDWLSEVRENHYPTSSSYCNT